MDLGDLTGPGPILLASGSTQSQGRRISKCCLRKDLRIHTLSFQPVWAPQLLATEGLEDPSGTTQPLLWPPFVAAALLAEAPRSPRSINQS